MKDTLSNIINLDRARILRGMIKNLHSPEMQNIIYSGAYGEFKHLISPALEKLLSTKGVDPEFKNEIISLLEKVYAHYHVKNNEKQSQNFLQENTQ